MADSNVSINVNLVTRQAQANAEALSRSVIGINQAFQLISDSMSLVIRGLDSVVGVFADATRAALDFNTGLVEIGTVAGDVNLDKIGDDLIAVSNKFGLSLTDIKKGYYDLVSAGVAVEDAQTALEVSSKLATTGFTSQSVAVNAVTGVMNAWGLKADELAAAGDSLAITVKKGKLTFEEYSGAIGNVSAAAAGIGISLNQTNAVIAALTLGNKTASEAATGFKTVLEGLSKPTKELAEAYKKTAGETLSTALASGDLTKIFTNLQKITGGNAQEMFKLFGSFEAGQAVVSLTGKQFGSFKDALGEMEKAAKSAGQVLDKDFAAVSESAGFKLQKAQNQIANLFVGIGKFMLPAVAAVSEALSEIVGDVQSFMAENKEALQRFAIDLAGAIKEGFVALKDFFGVLRENQDIIVSLGKGLVAATVAVLAYAAATKVAAIASAAFVAVQAAGGIAAVMTASINPVFLLAAAIGALVVAIDWVDKNTEILGYTFLQIQADISSGLIPVVSSFGGLINDVAGIVIGAAKAIAGAFAGLEQLVGQAIKAIGSAVASIADLLQPLSDALGGAFDGITGSIRAAANGVSEFGEKVKQTGLNDAADSAKVYDDALKAVTDTTAGWTKSQKDAADSSESLAIAAGQLYNESESVKRSSLDQTEANKNLATTLVKTAEEAAKLTEEERKAKEAKDKAAQASDEYRKKLQELGAEITKLNFAANNTELIFQMIDSDAELTRIAEVVGREKAAVDLIEQLRLKSIGKTKEADLLRAKLVAEASVKAAADEAKIRSDSVREAKANAADLTNNYRKNFDSFAASEVQIVKQTETDIAAIVKAGEDAAKRLADANLKQSEDNLEAKGANYRQAWDSFAQTETEIAKETEEDITKIVENETNQREALYQALANSLSNMARGLREAFEGVGQGIESIVSGDLLGGLSQAFLATTNGLGEAIGGQFGEAFKTSAGIFVQSMTTSISVVVNSLQTGFSLITGSFLAGLASGIEGIISGFDSTVESLKKGTEALNKFGDNSEKNKKALEEETKVIEDQTKLKIEAVEAETKKKLDALGEADKAQAEAVKKEYADRIELLKRKQELENAALADKMAKESSALKGLKGEELTAAKANLDKLSAVEKAARKNSQEDAVRALEAERDAKLASVNAEAAAIETERAKRIKAFEDEQAAALKATKDRLAEEDKARRAGGGVFGDIASSVDEFVAAFSSKVPEIVDSFISNLPKIINSITKAIPKIVDTLVKTLPKLIDALVKSLPKVIDSLVKALPAITKSLEASLPALMRTLVTEIPKLVGSLLDSIISMIPKLLPPLIQMIANVIVEIINRIPEILDAILQVIPYIIQELPKIISAIVNAIPGVIQAIVDNLPAIITAIVDAIPEIIDAVIRALPSIIAAIIEALPQIILALGAGIVRLVGNLALTIGNLIWDGIKAVFGSTGEWLMEVGTKIWEGLKAAFYTLGAWVLEIGGKIWTGLQDAFYAFGDWLAEVGSSIWDGIKLAFETAWGWLLNVGKQIWEGVGAGFRTAGKWLMSAGKSIWDGFVEAVNKVWDWLKSIGRAIWDGLSEGLSSVGSFITGSESSSGIPIIGPIWDEVTSWFADGGMVPGAAAVSGDSLRNDTVPAMLSPGELVVPRSVMQAGFGEIMRYVASQSGYNPRAMSSGGIVPSHSLATSGTSEGGFVEEVAALRTELKSLLTTLNKNTFNVADTVQRWNIDGLPETRTV